MIQDKIDCVVIGAGVIGLAIARAMAQQGREVIVLEALNQIGSETSSRNSEVIHAGIYYTPDSFKARFCVEGKGKLYAYLEERGLGYSKCGKVLVATQEDQIAKLHKLMGNAAVNGCDDLTYLEQRDVAELEPQVRAVAGVLSPSTGILDVHGYMQSLQGDLEAKGGVVALESPALGVDFSDDGILVSVAGAEPMVLKTDYLINSAGLHAIKLANNYNGFPQDLIPQQYYAKGNYFSLSGKHPFKHLIYPMPEKAGIGVHLTLDLAGQARFGPDVEWIDEIDYGVDETRGDSFYPAIRQYWPGLPDGALLPSYSGIRPKVQSPEEGLRDFIIQGPEDHKIAGLVNLFGIESPGITSSLPLADYVTGLLVKSSYIDRS